MLIAHELTHTIQHGTRLKSTSSNLNRKLIFMQTETQNNNKEALREEYQELAEGLLYTQPHQLQYQKNLRINLIPLRPHRNAQRKGIDLDRGTGQAEKSGRVGLREQVAHMQGHVLQISFCPVQTGCGRGHRPLGVRETVSYRTRSRWLLRSSGHEDVPVHCARPPPPVPCRGFTCENNEKWHVWNDYEAKVINQDLPG
jgi:hypothetical protein